MVVADNRKLIKGNTVLVPDYAPVREDIKEKNRKLRIQEREKLNKEKHIKMMKKVKVLRNIVLLFVLGVALIYRYCTLYNMQRNLSDIKNQISSINKENENLRVELVKYNNIFYLEDVATKNLKMMKTEKSMAVYLDLTKDNFENTSNKDHMKHESILGRIKNMLF